MFFIGLFIFRDMFRKKELQALKFAGEGGGSAFAVYAGLGIKVSVSCGSSNGYPKKHMKALSVVR